MLDNALPMLKRVTGDRIRHEIELALREADPIRVMERLSNLGVMAQNLSGVDLDAANGCIICVLPSCSADPIWQSALPADAHEFIFFALWVAPLPQAVQTGTVTRLKGRKSTRA